jgi:hypothetical protein
MFCSQCGKEATGKFCWNCGASLHAGAAVQAAPAADWQNEIDYDTLISNPEVRDLLAKQRHPDASMTGEEFVESFFKVLKLPIEVGPVIAIMLQVYSRLGLRTDKTRSGRYRQPAGRVIVAVLCALARGGYKIQHLRQASDGCVLECKIPSDLLS